MEGKINSKKKILFHYFIVSLFLILVYSRFVGLNWGLPYPMHPDERNMANAIQSLNCKISNFRECFNPHFFAYGQFPLYLGYLLIWISTGLKNFGNLTINFESAVISLRLISALASVFNVFVLIKIIDSILERKDNRLLAILIFIFSPFFIQFSHFGTTESLLMLFYSLIIYFSIKLLKNHKIDDVLWVGLVSGLAVSTKVSSVIFLIVPVVALISHLRQDFGGQAKSISKLKTLSFTFGFAICTLIFALIFSPHNFINFQDFLGSIRYESDVALGKALVFYTRQFFEAKPLIFQGIKIFPYVLGWPIYIMGLIGLISLDWTNRKINLLRFAFLVYFIPTAIIYAKWSRFMAPIFPIMTIFAIIFLLRIKVINFIKFIIIIIVITPGIAYLSVYQNPDVRFQASEWIYKNIPDNSYILSETANVVDIPIEDQKSKIKDQKAIEKFYQIISFNFYDLDESPQLQQELKVHLEKADYIFVPSRRIFANHPKSKYPILSNYYRDLFSGKLGYIKVAEFSSGLKDEEAEETWTVFDHPVIRIYKKLGVGLPDP